MEVSNSQGAIDLTEPRFGEYSRISLHVVGYDGGQNTTRDDAESTEGAGQGGRLTRSSRWKHVKGFDHSSRVDIEHNQRTISIV